MEGKTLDRISRRLALGGLAGGGFGALLGGESSARKRKKRQSPAKRCRRQRRIFCAGRCCPSGRRCQNGACVASCENPFGGCGSGGGVGNCGGDGCLGCVETASGASACVSAFGDLCADSEPCRSDGDCPGGTICVTCSCGGPGGSPDFRCVAPCASA